jgi:hypothetical protein
MQAKRPGWHRWNPAGIDMRALPIGAPRRHAAERLLPGLLPRQLALTLGHGFAVAVPALVNFVLQITFRGD